MQMLRQKVITVTYTQKRTSMDTREDWKNLILPSEREKDGVFLFSHKCQVLSFSLPFVKNGSSEPLKVAGIGRRTSSRATQTVTWLASAAGWVTYLPSAVG